MKARFRHLVQSLEIYSYNPVAQTGPMGGDEIKEWNKMNTLYNTQSSNKLHGYNAIHCT